ncbi:MAG: DUF4011 domain-containing protein [Gammaproteobacteria bacterium]|nr:DUF4011 domain-containing protein [Gammaproteobacteria bacterium]
MEVLSGNASEPERARRKQDLSPGDIRTLDWSSRPGDILLYPHSPLALVDVFGSEKGVFDLLPLEDENNAEPPSAHTDEPTGSVISLQSRKGRTQRKRANLLTCHSPEELSTKCKRALISNALVKQPGQKRLFIVTGFLKWKANEKAKFPIRSPLLFYPVILVNKRHNQSPTIATRDTHSDAPAELSKLYEVRLDSNHPESNSDLTMHCQRQWGITLPEFRTELPLQDYFAQVAEAIGSTEGVELEFDIALGTAAPPTGEPLRRSEAQAQLPELPKNFAAPLAMAIAKDKDLKELCAVLNLMDDFNNRDINLDETSLSKKNLSQLRELSKKLKALGLEHLDFDTLLKTTSSVAANINIVKSILGGKLINDILQNPEITALHLIRLGGVIELVDKFPMQLSEYRHADLCYQATPGLLRRARHQARLIEDEFAALEEYFVLDKIPTKQQLLSLIDELGHTEHDTDIVDADYFNARRLFMDFSVEAPTTLTTEHRRQLGQLAKVMRFRELFVNNTEYRMALGPGYRGLRTAWDQLEQMTDYSQELSAVLESEKHAARAIAQWDEFRTTYINELETLHNTSDALQGLLRISGKRWQHSPVQALVRHCQSVGENLIALLDHYGPIESHGSKTPAAVLAQFTGNSEKDGRVEFCVGEAQAQIAEISNTQNLSREAVVETLSWLKSASNTAAELSLDIDEILHHLNIA